MKTQIREFIRLALLSEGADEKSKIIIPAGAAEVLAQDKGILSTEKDRDYPAELREKMLNNENSNEVTLYRNIDKIGADVQAALGSTITRGAVDETDDVKDFLRALAGMLDKDSADYVGAWPYRTALFFVSWLKTSTRPLDAALITGVTILNPAAYIIIRIVDVLNESSRRTPKHLQHKILKSLQEGSPAREAVKKGASWLIKKALLGGLTHTAAEMLWSKALKSGLVRGMLDSTDATLLKASIAEIDSDLSARGIAGLQIGGVDLDLVPMVAAIIERSSKTGQSYEEIIGNHPLMSALAKEKYGSSSVPEVGPLLDALSPKTISDIKRASLPNATEEELLNGIEGLKKNLASATETAAKNLATSASRNAWITISGAALLGVVSEFLAAKHEKTELTPDQLAAIVMADKIRKSAQDAANVDSGELAGVLENIDDPDGKIRDALVSLEALFNTDAPLPGQLDITKSKLLEAAGKQ